ncbi:hypothetical protein TKK_0002214 [Trichogramma kaykai]|uniref:Uncharacterized protein n=1 Tax=Trichogramma kaykai TaxID=54128 RepID=A0ABD2XBA9_9HYME
MHIKRKKLHIFVLICLRLCLAERCVVRSVKTGTLKELTPHKKLTVEKHFEHYLNYYNDDPSIISYHMGKINNYANRAIGGSRKKLKAMKEYPEIDMEGIEEIDDDKIQL